jgi:hypothetical protein
MSNRTLSALQSSDVTCSARRAHGVSSRASRLRPRDPRAATAAAAAALVAFGAITAHAPAAYAAGEEVSPTGKGITGGALLGGEVVVIVEAIAGVRPTWAYAAGFGVGAIGGGVGGYFIEQSSDDGKAPMFMLAGGLALVIPALVLTLNATRYQPSSDLTEDRAPTNAPPADPGAVGGSAVAPAGGAQNTTPASQPPPAGGGAGTPAPQPSPAQQPPPATPGPPSVPLSLFDMRFFGTHPSGLRLGLPVPEVRPMYSMNELKQLGLQQQTEVRMPLVRVTF